VIESASEQSYYDYVDEYVFAPAGMTRSGSLPEETAVPDLSVGYTAAGGPVRPNTDTLPYRGTPAGGGYTTVEDVWRFATALIGHRLLDQTHTALVTSVQANARWSGPCVCYGFFERRIYGIRSFGHSGGAPGMSAELAIYPDSGHIVAVLANMAPPSPKTPARSSIAGCRSHRRKKPLAASTRSRICLPGPNPVPSIWPAMSGCCTRSSLRPAPLARQPPRVQEERLGLQGDQRPHIDG